MIDRERVAGLLEGDDRRGIEILEGLEAAGYQVVPEGLVPKFDDLESVAGMLTELSHITGEIHSPTDMRQAAGQISRLRKLALMVLRIDPNEVQSGD